MGEASRGWTEIGRRAAAWLRPCALLAALVLGTASAGPLQAQSAGSASEGVPGASADPDGQATPTPTPPATAVDEAPAADGGSGAPATAPAEVETEPAPNAPDGERQSEPAPEPPAEPSPTPQATETPEAPTQPSEPTPEPLTEPSPTPQAAETPEAPATPSAATSPRLLTGTTMKERKRRTVSDKELTKLGFFQDFAELSLDELLAPEVAQVTASVASRGEQPLNATPGAVTIVEKDAIVRMGAVTLTDILRTLPGFDVLRDSLGRQRVVARGVPSSTLAAFSETVLVMVNGQRIGDEVFGSSFVLNLDWPAASIKRLEVLRGPGSALYGSGAMAAVINIVTDEGNEDNRGIYLSTSHGGLGTHDYTLRLNNVLKEIKVAGTLRYGTSAGVTEMVPADAQTVADRARQAAGLPAISRAPGPVRDGSTSLETVYRLSYHDFDFNWRAFQGRGDGYIGYANALGSGNDLISRQLAADVGYKREVPRLGRLRVRASFTNNDQQNTLEILPPRFAGTLASGLPFRIDSAVFLKTTIKSSRLGLEAYVEHSLPGAHELLAGLSYGRETTRGLEALSNLDFRTLTPQADLVPLAGALAPEKRGIASAFVQDLWRQSDRLTLSGALRLDHISEVGAQLSPRLGAVVTLPRDYRLRVLYGRAYRTPTIAELSFNLPGWSANPDLRPVTTNSIEALLSTERQNLKVSGGPFAQFVRSSLVSLQPASPFDARTLENGPGYNIRGLEIEGEATIKAHSVRLAYALQRTTDARSGERVADLPTHLATLSATLALDRRWTLVPLCTLRSSRPRQAGDEREPVGATVVVDLNLQAVRLFRSLELVGSVRNLFNQRIVDPAPLQTVPGDYPLAGRWALIHASWKF